MCSYKIIGENHIIIIIIIITHSNNHSFVEIKLVISSSSCEGAHGVVAKATLVGVLLSRVQIQVGCT